MDIQYNLERPPVANGAECGLVRDIGISLYSSNRSAIKRLEDAAAFNGHAAFGIMLLDKGGQRSQFIGLAAPSKILSRRSKALHLLKKVALSFNLMQLQFVRFAEIPHILQSFRELEMSIDEKHIRVGYYLST
jgi:hypothetical protein